MINLSKYPVDRLPRLTDPRPEIPIGSQFALQAIDRVACLLDEAATRTHFQPTKLFSRALTVWETMSQPPWEVDPDYWLNTVCVGLERCIDLLQQAYAELLWQSLHNYEDILGGIYAQVCVGRKRSGQFFTPAHIARTMASVSLSTLEPRSPGDRPYRIADPACGSGVLLLAAAEYIELFWPHMLDAHLIEFSGFDIDPVCVSMANLNYRMHRAGRLARHMEELGITTGALSSLWEMIDDAPDPLVLIPSWEKSAVRSTGSLTSQERKILADALSHARVTAERNGGCQQYEVPFASSPHADQSSPRLFVLDADVPFPGSEPLPGKARFSYPRDAQRVA